MSDKIANQDIETSVKNVKRSRKAMEVVKEMEKFLEVISAVFCGLLTYKVKNLKDLNCMVTS